MKVLVTTGATYPFKQLIQMALSPPVLECLVSLGYTEVVVQYGVGGEKIYQEGLANSQKYKLQISGFDLSPEIHDLIKRCDLIISHGGTGSILDALRASKRLIAVINQDLMDNHQAEIADQFSSRKYLLVSDATPKSLVAALQQTKEFKFIPMPPPEAWQLASIIDEEAGLM
jgi:beta-1,4-N-acetylglucosaminyltransferase